MQSKRIRVSILILVAFAFAVFAPAVQALEKVGTTSMQVLKIPLGIRGIAMGNAMAGATDGAEATWWNPGAYTQSKSSNLILTQINMPADVKLNSLTFSRPWGEYGAFSLHAINLFTDDMKVRTWDHPEGTGENFNAYDFVLGAGYAQRLTDKFSLGGNLRYLRSGLEDHTYNGFSADAGTLYQTGLRSLKLGMCIQNLGPQAKYSGEFPDYRGGSQQGDSIPPMEEFEGANLPTIFRLGISFDVFEMLKVNASDKQDLLFAMDMNHPNDNQERLNIGAEYGFSKTLFLRAGGKFGYDEESFSAGFGLSFKVMNEYRLRFDYAYQHLGRITDAVDEFAGQPHRFSLGFSW